MLKKIKDCSYEEINEWANQRACDGKWSLATALVFTKVLSKFPKFYINKKMKQNMELQKRLKQENINLDFEIDMI